LVAGAVGVAWAAGGLLGHMAPAVVQLSAAGVLLASAGLIATEWLSFPEPYDPHLLPSAVRPTQGSGTV
jgi:hypothetical protein